MSPPETERNLLFGLLALQNHFIDRDGLVAAFSAWVVDKSRSLGEILVERGSLRGDLLPIVAALADKHLEREHPQHSSPHDTETREAPMTPGWLDDPSLPSTIREGEDDATLSAFLEVGAPDGRFQILRPHERGGLGEVFVANDRELHREVALKVIRGEYADDETSRDRFLREAEITGRLEHPGIVPVYGMGSDAQGRPYYAMRFIRGETLKAAIANFHKADESSARDPGERTLALRDLLGRFLSSCDAVAYAHDRGILHRDLKPSNILLGPFGETLVVDWGLAKPIGRPADADATPEGTLRPSSGHGSSETLPGSVQGTPAYMPPEQANGVDRLSHTSDVYSLGATLFCLLTGRAPYLGDQRDVLASVRTGQFPRPREVKSGIPQGLEAVCLKAMAAEPYERYPRIADLTSDLKHWLADEPVSAHAESRGLRLARWSRRHRSQTRAAAAAFVVVAVVSALAAITTIEHERNSLQRVSASLEAERKATGEARISQRLAASNLVIARRAIMQLLEQLAASDLATLPGVEGLRVQINRSAAVFIDRLLAANPKDQEVRRNAVQIYRERANIERGGRDFGSAEKSYARAVGLLDPLIGEFGQDADRAQLAAVLSDAGECSRMANRLEDSARQHARSLELITGLRARLPVDPNMIRLEARAWLDQGALFADRGEVNLVEQRDRQVIASLTPLADLSKPDLQDLLVLAIASRNLGTTLGRARRHQEALRVIEDAPKRLTGRDDNNSRYLIATILNCRGKLLADDLGRPDDAERFYQEAAEITSVLAAEFSHRPDYLVQQAAALNGRGGVRLALGRDLDVAKADCRIARSLLNRVAMTYETDPEFASLMGLTLDNLAAVARGEGKSDEAASLFRAAEEAHLKAIRLNAVHPEFRLRLDEHRRRASK